MSITHLLTTSALLHLASSQLVVPFCLQTCLTNSNTELCSSPMPSEFTSCIAKECLSPPARQNLIANLKVSYTPKVMYSCEQSFTPGDPDNSITLPLNQSCATSPYGFKSFIPHAASAINAANGCRVLIYSEEECLGTEVSSADLGIIDGGQCIFRGGRSARLTCPSELDAARAYIESACGGASSSDSASAEASSYTTDVVPDAKSTSSGSMSTSLSVQTTHWVTLPSSAAGLTTTSSAQTTYTISLPSTESSSSAYASPSASAPSSAPASSSYALDSPVSASSVTTYTITVSTPIYTLTPTSTGTDVTTYYVTLPSTSSNTTSATATTPTFTDAILTINPYTAMSGNATAPEVTTNAAPYPASMSMPAPRPENITSFITFTASPTATADLPVYTGAASRLASAAWMLGSVAVMVALLL